MVIGGGGGRGGTSPPPPPLYPPLRQSAYGLLLGVHLSGCRNFVVFTDGDWTTVCCPHLCAVKVLMGDSHMLKRTTENTPTPAPVSSQVLGSKITPKPPPPPLCTQRSWTLDNLQWRSQAAASNEMVRVWCSLMENVPYLVPRI